MCWTNKPETFFSEFINAPINFWNKFRLFKDVTSSCKSQKRNTFQILNNMWKIFSVAWRNIHETFFSVKNNASVNFWNKYYLIKDITSSYKSIVKKTKKFYVGDNDG